MFIQDIFVKYYDWRPFNSVLLNKVIGNLSKLTGIVGRRLLPWWFRLLPGEKKEKKSDVVACMTSFPARMPYIWIVFESLLRQKLQPRKILLYLSEIQFDDKKNIEESLKRYIDLEFLEIKWVKEDYRSYKKFWYYIKENPNQAFITLDDDIIYASDIIYKLINEANNCEKIVPACYCYRITKDKSGMLKSYSSWDKLTKKGDMGNDIFFGSGGGTFFPSGCLEDADFSYEIIKQTCPLADDIWLNAFIRKNKFIVKCVKNRRSVVNVLNKHDTTLSNINVGMSKNDEQLQNVIRLFRKKFNFNPFKI